MIQKNTAQEEAIQTIYGQILLVSCPGSGKTTTMLRRIHHMINQGIDPASILMVTFTEAAAREMRKRFADSYGNFPVTFCTIHSLCLRIIHATGMGNFHIMDVSETDAALKAAASGVKKYFEDFKNVRNDVSLFKNTGSLQGRSELSLTEMEFKTFIKAYENYKDTKWGMDFDDLLIHGKRLLTESPELLRMFRGKFRFIVCDEYQDTNPIQKEILYLLAGENGNLCVVGDDDQSIYGFRGAVPSIMLSFSKDFPNCKIIHMSTNYRSVPGIIQPASALISYNKNRFPKDIKAFRKGGVQMPVIYDTAHDRDGEMECLAEAVKQTAFAYGTKSGFAKCAVLTRTNAQLEQAADIFSDNGIPFSSKDVVKDVYEHWSYADLCAYLRLADGEGNIADFLRIANRPKRYLSQRLFSNLPYDKDKIIHAVYRYGRNYAINSILDYFFQMKQLSVLPFKDRIPYILNQMRYSEFLDEYVEQSGVPDVTIDAKLSTFIKDTSTCGSLAQWMQYAKKHIRGFHETVKTHKEDGVVLATMHRAKGLEWDHVFILDCCSGTVPYDRRGMVCDIEEERRLFYVAFTRARETLHIMNYRTRKGLKDNETKVNPSQFLKEMQTPAKKPISSIEQRKRREGSISIIRSGFQTDDLGQFLTGELVHHISLGSGTVVSNRSGILAVRFRSGVKIFNY